MQTVTTTTVVVDDMGPGNPAQLRREADTFDRVAAVWPRLGLFGQRPILRLAGRLAGDDGFLRVSERGLIYLAGLWPRLSCDDREALVEAASGVAARTTLSLVDEALLNNEVGQASDRLLSLGDIGEELAKRLAPK